MQRERAPATPGAAAGAAGRRAVRAALVLCCLVAVSARGAAAQQVLTLREAVALGLARHPAIALADAGLARAEAGVREATATLFPNAHLDASITRFQEPMVVAPLHGFDPRHPPVFDRTLIQGSATAGYTVFDGGIRSANASRASALREAAVAQRDAARQAVLAEVVTRYAAVRTARDLAAAHASRVAALEQERSRAARLLEQGRAARVVLLRAEAALSGGRAELEGAVADVESAERELARLLGLPAGSLTAADVELLGSAVDVPDRDAAVARAVRTNPELSRLAAEREARAAAESAARAEWWPRLLAGARYVQYGSGAGDAGGEWQTGIQLSYPLFTAGRRSAAVDRARAESAAADADLAAAELRIADTVDRALGRLRAARARAAAWQAAVEQSQEVVRIERLALDTGAGVQTDYLAAEAELLRARAALTGAQYTELVASVELVRALGELSEEWIARNLEPDA